MEPDRFGTRLPLTVNLRIKLFLTGVLFPGFSVAAGLGGTSATLNEPWQSGGREPYIALFLQSYGLACFLPFILLSAIAMSMFVLRPTLIKSAWIRLGIYTGAILALQFFIALFLVTDFASPFAAALAGPGLALLLWGISEVAKRIKRFTILHLMITTSIAAIFLAIGVATEWRIMGFVFFPLMVIFMAAPTLNLATYARVALLAAKHETIHRDSIAKVTLASLAMVSWISGFVWAWRQAIDRVLVEYQNLPTMDPNCFVASAAAYGTPDFVKAELIDGNDGQVLLNEQMQRLKFLELTLQSMLPRLHRRTRKIYNRVGPPLARCCKSSQVAANASYLLLKPLEWLAEGVRRSTGVSKNRIRQIYRG